jgi:hypothetical protein
MPPPPPLLALFLTMILHVPVVLKRLEMCEGGVQFRGPLDKACGSSGTEGGGLCLSCESPPSRQPMADHTNVANHVIHL